MGLVSRSLYTIFFGAIGGATVYYALQIDSPVGTGLIASASLGAGISFVITPFIRHI